MSDYSLEDTIYHMFTSRDRTGLPTTLDGSPVTAEVYEDNGTTQITAGVTLTPDFDAVVGVNLLTIAATSANTYEVGKQYNAVISAGTVDGNSVVGEVLFRFTIGLSSASIKAAAIQVVTDALTAAAAANLAKSAAGIIPGAATSGTLSTTQCSSDLTGFADNELYGRAIIFTGGTANGQASIISAYANTGGIITYDAIQTAPINTDPFVKIGRAHV